MHKYVVLKHSALFRDFKVMASSQRQHIFETLNSEAYH